MEYVPVSLGQTTETRFQIVRHLFSRFLPDEPVNVVRWCVFEPDTSSYIYDRSIFDDQITMSFATCEYLENDFKDIFKKEDLELTGDNLDVCNTQLMTSHPNLFKKAGEVLTADELKNGYAAARAEMDRRVDRFRAQLKQPEPRLYVMSEAPAPDELMRIVEALEKRAQHDFQILVHTRSLEAHANLPLLPNVDTFLANETINKPPAQRWEGDDEEWDRALGAYSFINVLRPRNPPVE